MVTQGNHDTARTNTGIQRRLYQDFRLKRQVAGLIRSVTGKSVSDEWAGKVIAHVLEGKSPADPWRYIRGAILGSEDPREEFLPISRPGYF